MPLPTYTPKVQLQQTSGLEFNNLISSIKQDSSLQSSMDKVSEWAFKKMDAKAEAEGAAWAAMNPPTIEELSSAQAKWNYDGSTVTGAAITKVRNAQIKGVLHGEALKGFAVIQQQIEEGYFKGSGGSATPVSVGETAQQVDRIVNTMTDKMATYSPVASVALKAELLTSSKSALEAAASKSAKYAKAAQDFAATEFTGAAVKDIENAFKLGDAANASALIDSSKANYIYTHGYMQTPAQNADFLKQLESTTTNALVAWSQSDKQTGTSGEDKRNAALKGDFGSMTKFYNTLSLDQQKAIKKEISSAFIQINTDAEAADKAKAWADAKALAPLYQAVFASEGEDGPELRALWEKANSLGADPKVVTVAINRARSLEEPNYGAMNNFLTALRSGKAGDDPIAAARRYGLTQKEFYTVFSDFNKYQAVTTADSRKAIKEYVDNTKPKTDQYSAEHGLADAAAKRYKEQIKKPGDTGHQTLDEITDNLIKDDSEKTSIKRAAPVIDRLQKLGLSLTKYNDNWTYDRYHNAIGQTGQLDKYINYVDDQIKLEKIEKRQRGAIIYDLQRLEKLFKTR